MGYITAIGTATPVHRISQDRIADFMTKAMQLDNDASRKLRTIFNATGIDFRHSVIEDYGRLTDFEFYPNSEDMQPFPSTQQRLQKFYDNALPLSVSAIQQALETVPTISTDQITHLIVVCCTGMYAPGLDIDIVKALGLNTTVKRTCITFMGCYAAFNALKVADSICQSDASAKVLIVCTELCSLHFQKEVSDDNLLANALFADGSAALLMEATTNSKKKLQVVNFFSDLAFEGVNDMAWRVGDLGFEMKLSFYIPDIIKKGIGKLTASLLNGLVKDLSSVKYFAIHPGGKKILAAIEQELNLIREKNEAAYNVLRNYGNMSSPTVLFVLQEIFTKLSVDDNDEHLLSFAFGPGLTLESMLLKINIG